MVMVRLTLVGRRIDVRERDYRRFMCPYKRTSQRSRTLTTETTAEIFEVALS